MVYTNRFFGNWDYDSNPDKELEHCCQITQQLKESKEFKESKESKESKEPNKSKESNSKPNQNYTIDFDKIKYKRENIFKNDKKQNKQKSFNKINKSKYDK